MPTERAVTTRSVGAHIITRRRARNYAPTRSRTGDRRAFHRPRGLLHAPHRPADLTGATRCPFRPRGGLDPSPLLNSYVATTSAFHNVLSVRRRKPMFLVVVGGGEGTPLRSWARRRGRLERLGHPRFAVWNCPPKSGHCTRFGARSVGAFCTTNVCASLAVLDGIGGGVLGSPARKVGEFASW
jgi:hypothetical protein